MSWEEQIKKAPFLDRDISDLEKVKVNVEHALDLLEFREWKEELPMLFDSSYKAIIESLNDAKLVLDGMQE